jgi:hypothetical protein
MTRIIRFGADSPTSPQPKSPTHSFDDGNFHATPLNTTETILPFFEPPPLFPVTTSATGEVFKFHHPDSFDSLSKSESTPTQAPTITRSTVRSRAAAKSRKNTADLSIVTPAHPAISSAHSSPTDEASARSGGHIPAEEIRVPRPKRSINFWSPTRDNSSTWNDKRADVPERLKTQNGTSPSSSTTTVTTVGSEGFSPVLHHRGTSLSTLDDSLHLQTTESFPQYLEREESDAINSYFSPQRSGRLRKRQPSESGLLSPYSPHPNSAGSPNFNDGTTNSLGSSVTGSPNYSSSRNSMDNGSTQGIELNWEEFLAHPFFKQSNGKVITDKDEVIKYHPIFPFLQEIIPPAQSIAKTISQWGAGFFMGHNGQLLESDGSKLVKIFQIPISSDTKSSSKQRTFSAFLRRLTKGKDSDENSMIPKILNHPFYQQAERRVLCKDGSLLTFHEFFPETKMPTILPPSDNPEETVQQWGTGHLLGEDGTLLHTDGKTLNKVFQMPIETDKTTPKAKSASRSRSQNRSSSPRTRSTSASQFMHFLNDGTLPEGYQNLSSRILTHDRRLLTFNSTFFRDIQPSIIPITSTQDIGEGHIWGEDGSLLYSNGEGLLNKVDHPIIPPDCFIEPEEPKRRSFTRSPHRLSISSHRSNEDGTSSLGSDDRSRSPGSHFLRKISSTLFTTENPSSRPLSRGRSSGAQTPEPTISSFSVNKVTAENESGQALLDGIRPKLRRSPNRENRTANSSPHSQGTRTPRGVLRGTSPLPEIRVAPHLPRL